MLGSMGCMLSWDALGFLTIFTINLMYWRLCSTEPSLISISDGIEPERRKLATLLLRFVIAMILHVIKDFLDADDCNLQYA